MLLSPFTSLFLPPTVSYWASLVAQMVKRLPTMRETWVQSLGWENPLEKEMATHSSILAWKIPWTEDSGRLQSMGSQSVGHNWATSLHFTASTCPFSVSASPFLPYKWVHQYHFSRFHIYALIFAPHFCPSPGAPSPVSQSWASTPTWLACHSLAPASQDPLHLLAAPLHCQLSKSGSFVLETQEISPQTDESR